jgi:hypothetical protein
VPRLFEKEASLISPGDTPILTGDHPLSGKLISMRRLRHLSNGKKRTGCLATFCD